MAKNKVVEAVELPGVSRAVQIQRLISGRLFVITPFNSQLLQAMKGIRGTRVRILPAGGAAWACYHGDTVTGAPTWPLDGAPDLCAKCLDDEVHKVEATLPDGARLLHVAKTRYGGGGRVEQQWGKLGFGWTVAANRVDDLAAVLHRFWPVELPAEKVAREEAAVLATRAMMARWEAQKAATEAKAAADADQAPAIATLFADLNRDVHVSVATDGRGITVDHPYSDFAPGREAGGRWNPTYRHWTGIPFANAPALAARLREVFGTRKEADASNEAARVARAALHAQQLPSSDKPRVPVIGLNRNQYEGSCTGCGKTVDPGKGLVRQGYDYDDDNDEDFTPRWEITCATCSWRHAYGLPVDDDHTFSWVDLGLTGPDVRLIIKAGHDLAEAQALLAEHGGLTAELRLILGVEAAINE
jgi:hypothetical protein